MIIKPQNPYIQNDNKTSFKIRWGMLLFWVIVIGGCYYFFRFSSFFQIKDFLIEGNKKVDSGEILKMAESLKGNDENLFKYPVDQLSQEIKNQFILIDKVNITRGVPSTIKIEIEERLGFLIWKSGDKMYAIDNKGYAFQEVETEGSDLKVVDKDNNPVNLGDKIATSEFVRFVNYINSFFEKDTGFKIKEIDVYTSFFEIEIVLKNNLKVKMDTTRSVKNQVLTLKKITPKIKNKAKQYIDLRAENWVYYK